MSYKTCSSIRNALKIKIFDRKNCNRTHSGTIKHFNLDLKET